MRPLMLEDLRQLVLAMLVDEARPLDRLDDEVRQALGMRARRRALRVDDLATALMGLVDSSDIWRARAQAARPRVVRVAGPGRRAVA